MDLPARVVLHQDRGGEGEACDGEDDGDAEIRDYRFFLLLLRAGNLDLRGDEDDEA